MRRGLPAAVYWLLVLLLALSVAALVLWIRLYVRDAIVGERELVAGLFDRRESLLLTALCLALVALPAGLLWRHFEAADSYGSSLELFFSVAFALSAVLAVIAAVAGIF